MEFAKFANTVGSIVLIAITGLILSGCAVVTITTGVAGAGIAVVSTAVDIGVTAGSMAVSATSQVVKAVVPGD